MTTHRVLQLVFLHHLLELRPSLSKHSSASCLLLCSSRRWPILSMLVWKPALASELVSCSWSMNSGYMNLVSRTLNWSPQEGSTLLSSLQGFIFADAFLAGELFSMTHLAQRTHRRPYQHKLHSSFEGEEDYTQVSWLLHVCPDQLPKNSHCLFLHQVQGASRMCLVYVPLSAKRSRSSLVHLPCPGASPYRTLD